MRLMGVLLGTSMEPGADDGTGVSFLCIRCKETGEVLLSGGNMTVDGRWTELGCCSIFATYDLHDFGQSFKLASSFRKWMISRAPCQL